jgi:hypothetical protein
MPRRDIAAWFMPNEIWLSSKETTHPRKFAFPAKAHSFKHDLHSIQIALLAVWRLPPDRHRPGTVRAAFPHDPRRRGFACRRGIELEGAPAGGRQGGARLPTRRGVAQSGSASGLGPEGRGFESLRPDHRFCGTYSFRRASVAFAKRAGSKWCAAALAAVLPSRLRNPGSD